MAYANLKSKTRRKRLKGHVEQHLTGWWYLYLLLRKLRLKGLATMIYSTPRPGSHLTKNGKPWKTQDIKLRNRFKLTVRGNMPEVDAGAGTGAGGRPDPRKN